MPPAFNSAGPASVDPGSSNLALSNSLCESCGCILDNWGLSWYISPDSATYSAASRNKRRDVSADGSHKPRLAMTRLQPAKSSGGFAKCVKGVGKAKVDRRQSGLSPSAASVRFRVCWSGKQCSPTASGHVTGHCIKANGYRQVQSLKGSLSSAYENANTVTGALDQTTPRDFL